MISEGSIERVYLACGSTDLRKSIDGLAVLVKEGFQLDPFSPSLFVFCNELNLRSFTGIIMDFGYTIGV